jgi:hypothetical protein
LGRRDRKEDNFAEEWTQDEFPNSYLHMVMISAGGKF